MSSSYAPPSSQTGTTFGNVVNSQGVQQAGSMAKATFQDVKKNIAEGHWSLYLLAMLGALAMVVVSALEFMRHILYLQWISAVFDIYTLVLGLLMVVLESGRQLKFSAKLEKHLYRNALFLKYIWGRGVVYFFAGSLMVFKRSELDLIVGGYVCAIAVIFLVIGYRTLKKLSQLRKSSCTPEQMQEAFAMADLDGVGSLTIDQFQQLTNTLGLDLNRREVEVAFIQIDYSHSGRLTYESIQMWWNEGAAEVASEGTAAVQEPVFAKAVIVA